MFLPKYYKQVLLWGAVAVLGAPPAGAQGADEPKPLVIFAGLDGDDEGGLGVKLGLDYGVGDETWLTVIGNYTSSSDQFADITTRSLSVGLEHSFGRFGISGDVSYWGDPDELDSTSFRGSFFYKAAGWRLALAAERRNVDVTFRFVNADDLRVQTTEDLEVDALGGRLSYSGDHPWSFHLGHTDYDYSRDPRLLNFLFRFSLLSASGLTLANSFLEYSNTAGVEYAFGDRAVFLELNADKGAVDELRIHTYSVGLLTPIAQRWDVEFRLGVADTEGLGSSPFGGVTFFLYR